MGYCMLIRTYFIDHVLHIINFIETLYIYYVFPDVVLTIWHVEHFLNYMYRTTVLNYLSATAFIYNKKPVFIS